MVGAGMGTSFGERLMSTLAETVQAPVSGLLVNLRSRSRTASAGVAASQSAVIGSPTTVFVNGRYRKARRRALALPSGMGPRSGLIIGSGDVYALGRTSGLSNVMVAAGVDAPPALVGVAAPVLRWSARRVGSPGNRQRSRLNTESTPPLGGERQTRLIAEVVGSRGEARIGRLMSVSGTAVAAHTAVMTMLELIADCLAGTMTAFQLRGHNSIGEGMDPVIVLDDAGRK